jgi:hypoxanthine-DNA glycosylase
VIRGFSPLAEVDARVLILGTVPSERSLAEDRYYAHPRNCFWPLMEQLFGEGRPLDYPDRVALLLLCGVAVWDVLQAAERPGSLDAAIVAGSEVPNDIAGFLHEHPGISTVFFNGAKAEVLFRRHVAATLPQNETPQLVRLPSTSPANAGLSMAAKLEQWRVVAEAARAAQPSGGRRERLHWLAGCWDLVEATFAAADGTVLAPWGDEPVGVLLVTAPGELSAHGGRGDRTPLAGEYPTPGEKQQAYDDYFSYYGRIVRVDDAAGTFVTAVEGATDPDWVGSEQLRYLDIEDDDSIVLRTPPLALAGSEVVGRFAWRRRRRGDAG